MIIIGVLSLDSCVKPELPLKRPRFSRVCALRSPCTAESARTGAFPGSRAPGSQAGAAAAAAAAARPKTSRRSGRPAPSWCWISSWSRRGPPQPGRRGKGRPQAGGNQPGPRAASTEDAEVWDRVSVWGEGGSWGEAKDNPSRIYCDGRTAAARTPGADLSSYEAAAARRGCCGAAWAAAAAADSLRGPAAQQWQRRPEPAPPSLTWRRADSAPRRRPGSPPPPPSPWPAAPPPTRAPQSLGASSRSCFSSSRGSPVLRPPPPLGLPAVQRRCPPAMARRAPGVGPRALRFAPPRLAQPALAPSEPRLPTSGSAAARAPARPLPLAWQGASAHGTNARSEQQRQPRLQHRPWRWRQLGLGGAGLLSMRTARTHPLLSHRSGAGA